ncbi:MAG: NAD kinase [Erysipelotrichaceae bacterium]
MRRFTLETRGDEFSDQLKEQIKERLIGLDFIYDSLDPELVISVGGDGTFLRAIHRHVEKLNQVAFVGVHTGTLGFFTDYSKEDLEEFYNDLSTKEAQIQKIQLLKISTFNGTKLNDYFAVNEMRVENVKQTQLINVLIDGEFFETFRGTGMCVSSQAGSTAYNRSLGGAILQEGLDYLQLTEITGIHHQAYRSLGSPLIIKKDGVIRLESDDFEKAILCYDHLYTKLEGVKAIECKACHKSIRLAHYKKIAFGQRLKSLF